MDDVAAEAEQLKPEAYACAEAFVGRYPRYLEPATAASQCRIATTDLVGHLVSHGHIARVIWVREPRTPFPEPHPRALHATEHALAQLDTGEFIDVTRRQYDSEADVPTFYASEQQLGFDWMEVNDDEDCRRLWRALVDG